MTPNLEQHAERVAFLLSEVQRTLTHIKSGLVECTLYQLNEIGRISAEIAYEIRSERDGDEERR